MKPFLSDELRLAVRDPQNKEDLDNLIGEIQAEQRSAVVPPALADGHYQVSADNRSMYWIGASGEQIRVLKNNENLEGTVKHHLPDGIKGHDLSLGRLLRGYVLGKWKGAEAEKRVGSIGDPTLGGYRVPTPLSMRIIDLARKKSPCPASRSYHGPNGKQHIENRQGRRGTHTRVACRKRSHDFQRHHFRQN